MSVRELEAEALKLTPEDRAHLLHQLALSLDSLEEPALTNDELETRWAEFQRTGEAVEATKLHERTRQRYGL